MARYLAGIRKQLQDVSDLFETRYGKESAIAEEAVNMLASVAHFEEDFLMLEGAQGKLLTAMDVLISRAS